ncbi:MAG TPA: hypothetical protein VG937_39680 [Polyangiaceae bacterium]|nr:hypothetical protein [Polyangiaceae bacterium]
MNSIKWSLAFLATCWASGCGSDSKDNDADALKIPIASSPLAGTIGGEAWAFDHAETESALSDEETFFLTFYAEPATACEPFFQSTRNQLIVIVPKAPGDYAINFDHAATFVVDPGGENRNLVSFNGHLVVDEVTATSVLGGIAVEYNAANHVNGRFEATICPAE